MATNKTTPPLEREPAKEEVTMVRSGRHCEVQEDVDGPGRPTCVQNTHTPDHVRGKNTQQVKEEVPAIPEKGISGDNKNLSIAANREKRAYDQTIIGKEAAAVRYGTAPGICTKPQPAAAKPRYLHVGDHVVVYSGQKSEDCYGYRKAEEISTGYEEYCSNNCKKQDRDVYEYKNPEGVSKGYEEEPCSNHYNKPQDVSGYKDPENVHTYKEFEDEPCSRDYDKPEDVRVYKEPEDVHTYKDFKEEPSTSAYGKPEDVRVYKEPEDVHTYKEFKEEPSTSAYDKPEDVRGYKEPEDVHTYKEIEEEPSTSAYGKPEDVSGYKEPEKVHTYKEIEEEPSTSAYDKPEDVRVYKEPEDVHTYKEIEEEPSTSAYDKPEDVRGYKEPEKVHTYKEIEEEPSTSAYDKPEDIRGYKEPEKVHTYKEIEEEPSTSAYDKPEDVRVYKEPEDVHTYKDFKEEPSTSDYDKPEDVRVYRDPEDVHTYKETEEKSTSDYDKPDVSGSDDPQEVSFPYKAKGLVVEIWNKWKSSRVCWVALGCGLLVVASVVISVILATHITPGRRENAHATMPLDMQKGSSNPWQMTSYENNNSAFDDFMVVNSTTTYSSTTVTSLSTTACQNGWSEHNSHCYKLMKDKAGWFVARSRCTNHGAYLVTINDSRENKFITSLILGAPVGKFPQVWMGLHKTRRQWQWIDGSLLKYNYKNWAPGQPDNGLVTREKCAGVYNKNGKNWIFGKKRYKGQWNDAPCGSRHLYVCEKLI
ncbi:hypothetical protein Bbelb_137460 [Branchiostoma belcheri]|nr:hypothetical protein Bbelb_137460 [Branchiostoma belcheri]